MMNKLLEYLESHKHCISGKEAEFVQRGALTKANAHEKEDGNIWEHLNNNYL